MTGKEGLIEGIITIGRSMPILLRGIAINIELLFALLAVGLLVGTVVALLQVYGGRVLGTIAAAYAWVFRGIPAMVLLFLFYFGPSQFGLDVPPFLAATLALGFRSSAYQSQIFRGALQAIPHEQMMAARSLGMSRVRAIVSIIIPQALRLSLAGWSNEFSSVAKDTTLAYVVGLNEVLRQARIIQDRHYDLAMLAYIAVALLFLILTYSGNFGLGALERRLRIPGLGVHERGG